MKLSVKQLRKVIAEEASVLSESGEFWFDKLVPEAEVDRIFAALPSSFDEGEWSNTMGGGRSGIPKGMNRIEITANPGKRVAKMLAAYEDYETGRIPAKKRARPEPWAKTFETIEGETCSVSIDPEGVIVLVDGTGNVFNFSFEEAFKCAAALSAAAHAQSMR